MRKEAEIRSVLLSDVIHDLFSPILNFLLKSS